MDIKRISMIAFISFYAVMMSFISQVSAIGPSFDCSKASTTVEKMICSDKGLSELDDRMEKAYSRALMNSNSPAKLKQNQREWLKVRNTCHEIACLTESYKSQLAFLESNMDNDVALRSSKEIPDKQKNVYSFKLEKDTGWNVCNALLENYNKLQPAKESFACELNFDSGNPQLSLPKWQELKIEDNLDVIYSIESHIPPTTNLPSFEMWSAQYLSDIPTGLRWREAYGGERVRAKFHPRLMQTVVSFESSGRLETVLAYTRERNSKELCRDMLKMCPFSNEMNPELYRKRRECVENLFEKNGKLMDGTGDYIVLFNPETRRVLFIIAGDSGAGLSSRVNGYLFLHRKRAYLALTTVSGISISRVERVVYEDTAIKPYEMGRMICNILPYYK